VQTMREHVVAFDERAWPCHLQLPPDPTAASATNRPAHD
jgi:hypothetical protein